LGGDLDTTVLDGRRTNGAERIGARIAWEEAMVAKIVLIDQMIEYGFLAFYRLDLLMKIHVEKSIVGIGCIIRIILMIQIRLS
jgi:hypothetical protein